MKWSDNWQVKATVRRFKEFHGCSSVADETREHRIVVEASTPGQAAAHAVRHHMNLLEDENPEFSDDIMKVEINLSMERIPK